MRQRWRLCEIRGEEVAFVLLSRFLNLLEQQVKLLASWWDSKDQLQLRSLKHRADPQPFCYLHDTCQLKDLYALHPQLCSCSMVGVYAHSSCCTCHTVGSGNRCLFLSGT